MSDNSEQNDSEPNERVQPASVVSSRMPGETDTDRTVGGAAPGAGDLDEFGETDAAGEGGLASGGDSVGDDDEHDRPGPDDAGSNG